jgi:DNA-binding transcriptional ArsR family regulator
LTKQRSDGVREVLAITKALSDESRLRALLAVKDGELCVCQIIQVLGLAPATVSRHMELLERAGLVRRRRQGRWRYYRLAGGSTSRPAARALSWVLRELRGDSQVEADARRTRSVRRRDLAELSACYRR